MAVKTAAETGKGTFINSSGAIYVGNGSTNNFIVTDTGTITATDAHITGEITSTAKVDIEQVVRDTIKEVGGKKIAFIGVATTQTLSKTFLLTVKDEDGELTYDFLSENHSQALADRVQQHIDEVKEKGADYIIILGHLGIEGDAEEENTSAGLLRRVTGVDALIDGHSKIQVLVF